MSRLLVAALLISGWSMAALSLHVVQTAGGFRVVTKNELGLDDTFVDARNWSRSDEDTHHTLYQRLRQLDKTSILDRDSSDQVAVDTHSESIKSAWERLQREAAARRRP
jgi:hypothetical protein